MNVEALDHLRIALEESPTDQVAASNVARALTDLIHEVTVLFADLELRIAALETKEPRRAPS